MERMFQPYTRYAEFTGRSRRSEYWLFTLLYVLVYLACVVVVTVFGERSLAALLMALVLTVFVLGSFIPSLAVSFRRLHDINRSAWWLLIAFLPIIGGLVLLIFDIQDGTPGDNRFGPDPKGRPSPSVVAAFS